MANSVFLFALEHVIERKKIPTEIYIDKKKWDNSNKMVNTDHPSYIPINNKIKSYHDRIKRN